MVANRLARKLSIFAKLTDGDRLRLAEAVGPVRQLPAHADILEQGDDPQVINVILEGWACRCRLFADGRRQIVALMLPGDQCDPHVFLLDYMDHAVTTLTSVTLVQIPADVFQSLFAHSPSLACAFHREGLATLAIQREWTASLGRRTGIERLAHLFCEVYARQNAIGLADAESCPLPMTQDDLADALGLTSVHINRTLRELRGTGLISLRGRRLTIHHRDGLAQLAHFDPAYLHFTERQSSDDGFGRSERPTRRGAG